MNDDEAARARTGRDGEVEKSLVNWKHRQPPNTLLYPTSLFAVGCWDENGRERKPSGFTTGCKGEFAGWLRIPSRKGQ